MIDDMSLFLEEFRDFLGQRKEEQFRLFQSWWEGLRPQIALLLDKVAEE